MKPKHILPLIFVFLIFVNHQIKADQAWSADKKRAFVEQCLQDTNVFVVNVPIERNPHRHLSPDEVNALWKQASRNGMILFLYPDGLPQGFFSNQEYKINGAAKSWYPNGQLAVDEQCEHGNIQVGTYYDESGKLLCEMKNGTGRQLVRYMQRTGMLNTLDCSITEYSNGVQNGMETFYSDFAKGEKIAERHYKDGKQNGVEIDWDKGIKISEHNYKDGLADGLEIAWYPDGRTNFIMNFQGGKIDGQSVQFLPDGSKYRERVSRNNEVVSEKIWFTNGVLMSEEFYGAKGMMAKSYDDTGKQTGEVVSGSGKLVVVEHGIAGLRLQVYKDGKMVEDRRLFHDEN